MVSLIRQAMLNHPNSENTIFVLDGFPRTMEMALLFEKIVGPCHFVLSFECPENILIERLTNRGRTDDVDVKVVQKRIDSYNKLTRNVIEYYSLQGKVRTIDTSRSVQQIFDEISPLFKQ